MKVTRLRVGVRLQVSDGEFEALGCLTELAVPLVRDKRNQNGLTPRAKRAIRSPRFTQGGGPLFTVDEDRRGS